MMSSICLESKRLFDLLVSFCAVGLLAPIMAILAILIKLDSGGPVLYKGERVGRNGKIFRILKFRSMIMNADQMGGSSTPDDDPRITNMGRFLRKHKLDELPQLLNVLRGEMSFVGPRPQVQWAVDLYTEEERRILSVRPGITDYASIYFSNEGEILSGSADPDRDYMEKIHPRKTQLALKYVDDCSLLNDIRIIAETLRTVLKC
jgi:lipopolysaccharide/colanic/teichoic acid biosynthesis glycosyltransferase